MTTKKKIIGWVRKPSASKSTVPKAPSAIERQKAEWKRQVKEAEDAAPSWPRATEKRPGLLDDLPDDLSPDDLATLLIERTRREKLGE